MKKILVIEDDAIIGLSIVELLNANGFDTIVALEGYTGVQLAKENVPDLITYNVNILELSSYDVLKEIQLNPITANIPFILISSEMPQLDREQLRVCS